MKFYLAPMEGLTGYIYRNTFEKHFGNIDKYFTPFITPNNSISLKTKELKDIMPENNQGLNVIPQILTNNAEGFINTARKFKEFGYEEINLNLGCPSGTVVSKSRGSGFLAKREELDRFLDEIYTIDDMKISVKTRIGLEKPEEFHELLKIYNKYPMEELIIHPRTRKDFYANKPNLEIFKAAVESSSNTLCYNGDLFTTDDYNDIREMFPTIESFMLGRGLLANPNLVNEIKTGNVMDKNTFKAFHDELLDKYFDYMKEDRNTLFKMKGLWVYMMYIFADNKKHIKRIRKSQNLKEYREAIDILLSDSEIVKGAGLFSDV